MIENFKKIKFLKLFNPLRGWGNYRHSFPRASHGAIVINVLQTFSYPPNGGLNNNSHECNSWTTKRFTKEPRIGVQYEFQIEYIISDRNFGLPTSDFRQFFKQ